METKILNVKITETYLGKYNHTVLTCMIYVEGDGSGGGFGGFALDNYDKEKGKRVSAPSAMECISEILDTLEVEKWEDLVGQFVRIETTGFGGRITRMGHLIKDKWFSFDEFFNRTEKDNKRINSSAYEIAYLKRSAAD